ncbi:hypothetical protein D3C85_1818690 [compost metagenome]
MTGLVYILDLDLGLDLVDCCTPHSDTGLHNLQAGMTVLALVFAGTAVAGLSVGTGTGTMYTAATA